MPDPAWIRWRWRWRRWRAAHYEWAAWVEYHRWPSPGNEHALEMATNYVRRLELMKP